MSDAPPLPNEGPPRAPPARPGITPPRSPPPPPPPPRARPAPRPLIRARGQLDAARLAAPAREHLRLDDHGPAQLGGGCARLARCERDAPVGDGDSEAREQLLPLVLVQIHLERRLAGRVHGERRVHGAGIRERE